MCRGQWFIFEAHLHRKRCCLFAHQKGVLCIFKYVTGNADSIFYISHRAHRTHVHWLAEMFETNFRFGTWHLKIGKQIKPIYPSIMRASSATSLFSSGLPPNPTVPSHCSRSHAAQPSTMASIAVRSESLRTFHAGLEIQMKNKNRKRFDDKGDRLHRFCERWKPCVVADVKFHVLMTIGQCSHLPKVRKFNKTHDAVNTTEILIICPKFCSVFSLCVWKFSSLRHSVSTGPNSFLSVRSERIVIVIHSFYWYRREQHEIFVGRPMHTDVHVCLCECLITYLFVFSFELRKEYEMSNRAHRHM